MIVEARGDTIKLSGRLLENHWLTLKAAITLLLHGNPSGVVIDCQDIVECGIRGVETFVEATRFITAHRAKILFANLPQHLLTLLRGNSELRSGLLVAPTIEDARRALMEGEEPTMSQEEPLVLIPILKEHHLSAWLPHACQVGQLFRGTLYFTYIHIVPLTQPLDAPFEEGVEVDALLKDAEHAARHCRLKSFSHICRIRKPLDFLETVKKVKPVAVLCFLPHEASETLQELVTVLQKHAPVEVIVLTPGQNAPAKSGT